MTKMQNKQVMNEFLDGDNKKAVSHTGNLFISLNKLINYETVIAEKRDGKVLVSRRKYSKTTSKIQTQLRAMVPQNLLVEVGHSDLN